MILSEVVKMLSKWLIKDKSSTSGDLMENVDVEGSDAIKIKAVKRKLNENDEDKASSNCSPK